MPSKLVKANISQAIGQALIDDLFLQKSRFYFGLGRSYTWGAQDTAPEVIETEKYQTESRRDVLFLKQIEGTSIAFTIPRVNYAPGIVYDIYDDAVNIEQRNFYVMNSNFNVFKCLYNANGQPSQIEPFGTAQLPVTYDDGYVWKFIYTIPPALRNKFLTSDAIPVYNAITERYYSRGTINSVYIDSTGEGYTNGATSVVVSGDGYLENNPFRIIDSSLVEGGSGYTTQPTATLQDPVGVVKQFAISSNVLLNEYLIVDDSLGKRLYLVVTPGVTDTIAPSHFFDTAINGTAELKHVAIYPKIDVSFDQTGVGSVVIIDGGFGYTLSPSVTKSSPGTGVEFLASRDGDAISTIRVIESGTGYTDDSVLVQRPFPSAIAYALNTPVTEGQYLYYTIGVDEYIYRVETDGSTGSVAPSHTTGTELNGTVLLSVVGRTARAIAILGVITDFALRSHVDSVTITAGGTGYIQESTTVTFVGGNPTVAATAQAIVSGGEVADIVLTTPGYGYENTPTVQIDGVGAGAIAVADLEVAYGYNRKPNVLFSTPDNVNGENAIGSTTVEKTNAILEPFIVDGRIKGINIIDGGVGYTTATLTILGDGTGAALRVLFAAGDLSSIQAQTELLAIPGTVSSVVIEDGGSDITSFSYSIDGDGTGAVLDPVIEGGILRELRVSNQGQDYTFANININVNSGGTQPVVRAILSPAKGHASNPIKEFYTKSVALFGEFSDDFNQGVPLQNEFRQIMVYKNPLTYNGNQILRTRFASSCILVRANFTSVPLTNNLILTNQTNGTRYRVIDFTATDVLLQNIGNVDIAPRDILEVTIDTSDYTFTVNSLVLPTVDKFSGELLYIDNVSPFIPTENQAITINTTINLL